MGKLKVGMVVRNLEYVGGTERFLSALLALMAGSEEFEPHLICLEGVGSVAEGLARSGVTVHSVEPRTWFDLTCIPALARLFRSLSLDIVHSHLFNADFLGVIAARLARVPVVSTKYCMFSRAIERGSLIERIWTKPFIDRALEPAICRLTDRVLAVSNGAENYFASLGVARHKLLVCPCAHIDPSVPRVASSQLKARQRFRLPADAVVVGSVARLVPEKGIDTLVEGFALLVDEVSRQHLHQRLILVLAGDGFLRPQLERLASRLGIESNVVFVGTTNEVGLFLRCLDIFVLTSRTEGLPLAVQEAMWYGLPIVATAVGGIPELLADGGGVLIDPDRPGRLAEQLAQLTIDVDRRQVLGSKGTIAVETQYNIRYAYKVLADLYLSLV